MASQTLNVLLTSFPGLNVPSTLALPLPASTSITELRESLHNRIPAINDRLIITTISNKQLPTRSDAPISEFLSSPQDAFLSLRLSVPLCGGKGGFGSQLRAAGGRMSSKRKKNQGENNGSSRNLDGRRLRTVTEAKALAEYLAIKPEMDKKQKEDRRNKWEQIVALAEKREEEIKSGSKGKVDGKWVEDKEEAGERTREAVLAAMRSGDYRDNLLSTSARSGSSASGDAATGSDEEMGEASSAGTTPPAVVKPAQPQSTTFFGFDEDDEFMSDDEEESVSGDEPESLCKLDVVERKEQEEESASEQEPEPTPTVSKTRSRATAPRKVPAKTLTKGKGKGKAKA